jgi:hypothetical protein
MNKQAALKQLNKLVDITTLTPSQVAVEVAKDVIASLILDKIKVDISTYADLRFAEPLESGTTINLRDKISSMTECQVCAIGSVLVAFVSRFNNFYIEGRSNFLMSIVSDKIINTLSPYFSREQLSLMEMALGDFTLMDTNLTPEQLNKAREFFIKENGGHSARGAYGYVFDKERLIAIMQNVIDHDGTFEP